MQGGNKELRAQIKEGHREIIGKRPWRRRRTFQEVVAIVEGHRGSRGAISGFGAEIRAGKWSGGWCGGTRGELGEKAGRADYAAVGMALKRFKLKMKKDPAIRTETQMLE